MTAVWRIRLFAVAVGAALAVPMALIIRYERVLRNGTPFRFRTQPVDPADPFRGRYVQLRFALSVSLPPGWKVRPGETLYARLGEDEEGFARIEAVSRTRFADSVPYVRAETGWWLDHSNRRVRIEVPFTQFYMNEWKAPEAERAYQRLHHKGETSVWAVVRIWRGKGVIEELYYEGVPVRQYLAEKGLSR